MNYSFHKKILGILLGICTILPSSIGIDTLFLNANFQKQEVIDFGALYLDKQKGIDFSKVKSLANEAFTPLRETGIFFPADNVTHWIKCYLKNESDKQLDLVLHLQNPRVNKAQVFIIYPDGHHEHSDIQGDIFPFQERSVKHRNLIFPIRLPANSTIQAYAVVHNHGAPIRILMTIHEKTSFEQEDKRQSFVFACIIGFSICICLLSLIFTIAIRSSLWIYFTLYFLSVAGLLLANFGYGFQYFWGLFPKFNDGSGYFFTCTSLLFLLALTRTYMNTKQLLPLSDIIMKVLQATVSFFAFYVFFSNLVFEPLQIIMHKIGMIVLLVSLIMVIFVSIKTYVKEKKPAILLFLLGFVFVMFNGLIHVFENFDIIDIPVHAALTLSIGFGIDILILLFLIGNHTRKNLVKNYELSNEVNTLKIEAANALFEGQQKERKRLSVDLHDGISLRMATIKMRLSNLLETSITEQNKEEINELLDQMGTVSEEIRNFTHELMPLDLSESTLIEAIEDMIYMVEQAGPDLAISFNGQALMNNVLTNTQSHALFQTLQELLNNSLKHADATNIHIRLSKQEDSLSLELTDNGKGIQSLNNLDKGIGLKNIQSRATLLNGAFEIIPLEKGSRFRFSLPL